MDWSCSTAGELKYAYNILVWKSEGKGELSRPKRTSLDSITIRIRERVREFVEWIHLVQDAIHWWDLWTWQWTLGYIKCGKFLDKVSECRVWLRILFYRENRLYACLLLEKKYVARSKEGGREAKTTVTSLGPKIILERLISALVRWHLSYFSWGMVFQWVKFLFCISSSVTKGQKLAFKCHHRGRRDVGRPRRRWGDEEYPEV
jgi:hypothetical protein